MPEPSDEQLKDKVQKLERLLRTREERIVALETENAMLYLKLAQCQGSVRSYRTESNNFRRLFEAEEGFKKNAAQGLKASSKQIQDFKSGLHELRGAVKALPVQISQQMERAKILSSQFGTKKLSNMEELQSKLLDTEMALDVALRKAATEKDRRRTLHNTLVEIRGNIRVLCRVRPLIARLDAQGDKDALGKAGTPSEQVVFAVDEENISVNTPKQSGGQRQFEFERVFNPKTTSQEVVFSDVAPLLTSLLDGYNVCIMAYGQTGSGKTHTMMGSHDVDVDIDSESLLKDEGIIPRAAKELLRLIAERENPNETHSLEVAVCEIYNNEVRDLLAGKNNSSRLDIVTSSEGATEIPSLVTRNVKTIQEVMAVVYYGMQRRREDSTMVHAHSSRSHLIVQINLYTITTRVTSSSEAAPSPPGTPTRSRRTLPTPSSVHASRSTSPAPRGRNIKRSKSPAPGRSRSRSPSPSRSNGNSSSGPSQPAQMSVKTKLQLVDLAGSESVGMSGVTGAALRETSFINKSLSALADVLGALSEHRSHVPYRNTRLTHMLQDTIGGDAKLVVMLCVSQVQRYITETLQCLGFGSRARQIARGQTKKRRPTSFVPSSLSLDLSQVTPSLRGNGGALSPRIMDLRGGSRRKSNFNFPD